MTVLYTEGATQAQMDEAKGIMNTLCDVYPHYPWSVRVYEGGFFIKNLAAPKGWGMNCKYKKFGYSASEMKREIIMKAGEFLERAGLVRGLNRGEEIVRVEGIPEKYQPHQKIELKEITGTARDAHRQMSGMNEAIEKRQHGS